MTTYPEFTLAAIQAAPVYFDRDASTEKACALIEQAARKGATLAAFSETWLPGYPFFHNSLRRTEAAADYLANAIEIPNPATDRLCLAAREAGIDVVIGVVELDKRTRGTVYCTILFIGCDGKILGRHRKLKPTNTERTVWGEGDGVGLRVYERPYGRISGLACWEHMMLLPGYALMAQGTQIHVATWPYAQTLTDFGGLLLSRTFALQGSCYVIAVHSLLRPDDVPEAYRDLVRERDRNKGETGSCIIVPGGEIIAAAPANEETIVTSTVSLEAVLRAKARLDVGGHYSRPDVLKLLVNSRPLERLSEAKRSDSDSRGDAGAHTDNALGAFSAEADNQQETVREAAMNQPNASDRGDQPPMMSTS
jgi:predicted amidohydrolase